MPSLIDMKYTPKEIAGEKKDMSSPPEADIYPYGLVIHLDDESMSKLGVELKAGEEVTLVALAKVKRVSTKEEDTPGEGSEVNSSAELQITSMAVEGTPASNGEKATRMFPSMSKN